MLEISLVVDLWCIGHSKGDIGSLDYREMAPSNSDEDMYLDDNRKAQ